MDLCMSHDQQSSMRDGDSTAGGPYGLDTYADHLAQLSMINPVTLDADLLAADGELLLAQGVVLDPVTLNRLKDKTLARPLAQVVSLASTISGEDLHQHLLSTIRATEYFQALAERKYPLCSLEPVCARLSELPLISQYLTVMSAQMKELYQRTLCVSLWALFIAQEMRLPVEDTGEVFWAAITHDIGMLHINSQLLNKTEHLTAEDWLCVQSHVDISRRILLGIPGVSAALIEAVSEHHERCDGTGYPLAKVESELTLFGQILALADSIVGIYTNRFKAQGRRWREVIPVLGLNRAAYMYRSCDIITNMILRSELPLSDVVSGTGVPEFAERMLQQNLQLQHWFAQLRDCLTAVGYTHGDRKLHALQNVMLHIATTFKGSMLFKEDLRESLESMAGEEGTSMSRVVADASLIQQEMTFHLQRLSRMIQMYISSDEAKDPKILARIEETIAKVGCYLRD
jgi:hypothetical protein